LTSGAEQGGKSGSESDAEDVPDTIIAFTRGMRYDALPEAVVAQTKRLLLDGISWMVMGARRAEARTLLNAVAGASSGGGMQTVVGTDRKAPADEAVFLNSCFAQVHDCNDVRRLARRDGGSNHPGRGVVPAALTIAEEHGLSGRELIELLVVGYEIASRVDGRLPNHEYSLAIAAMAARASGMENGAFRRAVLLAHSTFPLRGGWAEPTDFDFLINGLTARAAYQAFRLAAVELSYSGSTPALRMATPLPTEPPRDPAGYAIMMVSIKPYPCCRSLHGAIDLALEIRGETGLEMEQIEAVEVRVGNSQKQLFLSAPPDAHYKRCQFSIPYVTACAFLDGVVDEHSFAAARIAAPDVAKLQRRIRVVKDEQLAYNPEGLASMMRPTALAVETKDGRSLRRNSISPLGSVLNPLSDPALREKFERWTGPAFPPDRKAAIIATVDALEDLPGVATLMALLISSGNG
jgi:2-methylcitrate dehydratase PrpD